LALVAASADQEAQMTESQKSLIAQVQAAVAPPSNACGAGSVSLTGLTKTGTNNDYTGKDSEYTYYMNVCAASTYGGTACSGAGYGICQYNTALSSWVASLGTWGNAVWAEPSSTTVTATMKDGTECYQSGAWIPRVVIVTFTCGTSTSSTFSISEEVSTCTFSIGLNANCGGGSNNGGGGMSGGTVFLIILIVLIPVYIAAGCVYKMKTKGTTGVESCPNVDFWRELPGLVKDGFRFTFSKCRGGSGSYNQV